MCAVQFPFSRPRRLRQKPWIRHLTQENILHIHDFVLPVFIREENISPICDALPDGIRDLAALRRYYPDQELIDFLSPMVERGLCAVLLFPIITADKKNAKASAAFDEDTILCKAIRLIKSHFPDLGVMVDVALDPYTDHGHDGILKGDGQVDNDQTVAALARQAFLLAKNGADCVAPSDMMDGRVEAIRHVLEQRRFHDVLIMSYAAKYASCFYGPFRHLVQSQQKTPISKLTYQMHPAQSKEAVKEIVLDESEAADIIMIKPAMHYLDIVKKASETTNLPIAAYHVSGEFMAQKLAAMHGLVDWDACVDETLLCLKRAGANIIISYMVYDAIMRMKSSNYVIREHIAP